MITEHEHYDLKLEIPQVGYNYTIDDLNNYEKKAFYTDNNVSEVKLKFFNIHRVNYRL